MPRTGRPKIDIRQDIFEGICRLQCTKEEVWSVLKVSEATLRRWVKRTYGANSNFDTVRDSLAQVGKMSLRRAMFKNADEGNAQVQIFLAKNILGMAEKQELTGKDGGPIVVANEREVAEAAIQQWMIDTGDSRRQAVAELRAKVPEIEKLASELIQ